MACLTGAIGAKAAAEATQAAMMASFMVVLVWLKILCVIMEPWKARAVGLSRRALAGWLADESPSPTYVCFRSPGSFATITPPESIGPHRRSLIRMLHGERVAS